MNKLLHIIILQFAFIGTMFAQNNSTLKFSKEPTFLPEENSFIPILGVSPNGKYIYGTYSGKSFLYNTDNSEYKLIEDKEDVGLEIVSMTANGDMLISMEGNAKISYSSNKADYILKSPSSDLTSVHPTYITPDANFIVGYFSNNENTTCPFIMIKNEKGEYVTHTLEAPTTDGLGLEPQWCTSHFCTNDGNYVVGRLCDYRGGNFELVIWTKNTEGLYTLSRPTFSYFFNTDAPLPGVCPEWEDYVTVDYDDPVYEEQETAFNEALDKWLFDCKNRVKPYSLGAFDLNLSSSGEAIMGSLVAYESKIEVFEGQEEEVFYDYIYPYYFNLRTQENVAYPEYRGHKAQDLLADEGLLTVQKVPTQNMDQYLNSASVSYPTKNITPIPFTQWVKDKTGKDISEDYTYDLSYYDLQTQVLMGYPYVSADGKTIAFCGLPKSENAWYGNSYMIFDQAINVTTNINQPETKSFTENIYYHNKAIYTPKRYKCKANIYDTSGLLIAKNIVADDNGKINLPSILNKGIYIIDVTIEKEHKTLKIEI